MLRNYFKTAWRNLRRHRSYSFINIIGLSLGLACSMLILLYVKDEVSFDRWHKQVNSIYRVTTQWVNEAGKPEGKGGNTGFLQGPRFTAGVPAIRSFVRVRQSYEDFKKGDDISSREVLRADSSFFSVFSFPLLAGNPSTCLIQPNAVVLSEEEAQKQFGTKDALGRTLLIRNYNVKGKPVFAPYVVTGIARRCPRNSSIQFNILLPINVPKEEEKDNDNWENFFLNTFVLLAPDVNPKTVESTMQRVYETDAREVIRMMVEKFDIKSTVHYQLQPFTDMHLSKDLPAQNGLSGASNPIYSYILSGIALFILLIACINFINLTLARSLKRAKEIGIRKVVGGEKRQLQFQFLGESLLLSGIAFILAIGISQVILPVFNRLADKNLSLAYLADWKLVGSFLLLFLLTGLLAGYYPALVLSRYNPVTTLYNRFRLAGKDYLLKSLVVIQFALASFLIAGTFIIQAQFDFLTHTNLGYDDHNLVVASNPGGFSHAEARLMETELSKDPHILGTAVKNAGYWGTTAKINGDAQLQFAWETVDVNYLSLLQIPVLKGRNFSPDFPADSTHSVLVNEAFVKKAGWKQPLGQELNFWYDSARKYKVIGVVKDYHFEALNNAIAPQAFNMKPSNRYGNIYIRIRPGTEAASLHHIEKVFKAMFPLSPYSYVFKDEDNRKQYESEAKWRQILLLGATFTIFISCIGLFGLSVLSAEKRTKEVGIRKVLGASVSSVTVLLSRQFITLVGIALLISLPLAWMAAGKWLQNYPYRISLSWKEFTLAGVMVIFIALMTVSFQAIKAAMANPAGSLRSE